MSVSSADPREQLRPAQALLSPAWVLALVVLLANDHWLKGAGLMPEVVTGKLSDFAGMIVAPTLLAGLLGVRSRRALLACHAAVGLVFAGIQLVPGCAALWTALTGLVGYPWTIVGDATDLLALPMLGLSWAWLVPYMDPQRSPLQPLQRTAVASLAALGLWASVATTEQPEWEFEPVFEDVFGNVHINNANEADIALHVRYLRADMVLDCHLVAEDPGRLLSSDAFGEAEHWLLPPHANVGIELVTAEDPSQPCGAAWVAGEGIEPTILFVDVGSYPRRWFPGRTELDDELFEGGMRLTLDEDNRLVWSEGDDLRFTPRTDAPAQPDSCEGPASESRIEWEDDAPARPAQILAIEQGIDGCFSLELQDVINDNGEIVPFDGPYVWYLCAPTAAVPFVLGEYLGVERISGGGGTRELDLTLLDPSDLSPATNGEGARLRTVRLLRGGNDPQFIGPAINRELEAVRALDCAWQLEPGCATAERRADLRVVGAADPMPIGEPVAFADNPGPGAMLRTTIVTHMRERAAIDTACASGSSWLSYDIDLAVLEEPLL